MKNFSFLADLSDVDCSFVYELNSVEGEDSRDVYFDYSSSKDNLSDEEVEAILKENGFYRERF